MNILSQIASREIEAEESRIKAKVRAHAAGIPEAENSCVRCGCESKIPDGDTCRKCNIKRMLQGP